MIDYVAVRHAAKDKWGPVADDQIGDMASLALFLGGSADSFTGQLLTLIAKADKDNLAKLAHVYPKEVALWVIWNLHVPLPSFVQMEVIRAIISS